MSGAADASGSVPLTMEEKRRLADGVHRLEPHQLSRVLSIIQEFVPVGAGRGEEEVELDINALDSHTLR